jgi:hypothetical protein
MSTRDSGEVRQEYDWYVDPEWCTELLLCVEDFAGLTVDPACGQGNIIKVCRAHGIDAVGSDIVDRGFEAPVCDFLSDISPYSGDEKVFNIICNPPYDRAEEFIYEASMLAHDKIAMLVQEKFVYSQKRYELFTQTPLARLWFFSTRPSMPPGELLARGEIEAKGGSVNYLWMVWQHGYDGMPTCGWLIR